MPELLASVDPGIESQLLMVLIQLVLIILAARCFALLFRRLGQPAVVGEIAAGLMLGPSVLGRIPKFSETIFNPAAAPTLGILSQLGLVFLLFIIGLEFDFTHLKARARAAFSISVMGIVLPFILGWGLAQWMLPRLDQPVDPLGFGLFMGTAMSITAIPVLARIMMELNIARTRIGTITITAAASDDAAGWIILAAVTAMVKANYTLTSSLTMILETMIFGLLMIFAAKPLLCGWIRHVLKNNKGELGLNAYAILLAVIFLCAIITNLIGIFAIFGAFILGTILSSEHEFRQELGRTLRSFVTVFFLPIFFTYTGLRTDIGSLQTPELWLMAAAVSLLAIAGKFGGCTLAAKSGGFSWRESACIGTLMNTRGLMELIVINAGYELGVVPKSVFCMLVLMALLTTAMTTPLLLYLMRGTELEPCIATSEWNLTRR